MLCLCGFELYPRWVPLLTLDHLVWTILTTSQVLNTSLLPILLCGIV